MSRLVGLWASALLVVAACSSSVTIGEDDAGVGRDGAVSDGGGADGGGGTDSGVDAGGGEPCGDNVCGAGEYCCNASCGWCAAEGVACPAIACEPEPVYCNGERCDAEGATCCPGCSPGESFCSGPEGACPDLACPPPPVECPDGTACGVGEQCCPGATCAGPYECRPEGDPCPLPPACPPNVCDDGTVCGDTERCCPGCFGEYLCSSADVCPVVDCPPPPPGCEAQNARGRGACEAFFGYAWDGDSCVGVSGCSCEGTDCDSLYPSLEACTTARAECLPSPGCEAQSARGVGACDLELGVVWNGGACQHISGCSCEGTDCDSLYPSVEACMSDRWSCLRPPACTLDTDCGDGHFCDPCATSSCPACDDCVAGCAPHECPNLGRLSCRALQPECGPDGVAIVGRDGCWVCVDARTCEPLPPG